MNVRTHMPDNAEGIQALAEKVAILHKDAIMGYLDRMMLIKNERVMISNEILNNMQKENRQYEN